MSNPWLPTYLGSWEQLLDVLFHNPFLGGGKQRVIPLSTHAGALSFDDGVGPVNEGHL